MVRSHWTFFSFFLFLILCRCVFSTPQSAQSAVVGGGQKHGTPWSWTYRQLQATCRCCCYVCVLGGGVRWLTNACNSSYRDPMPSTHTRVCILTQRHTHIYTISTEISKSFFFLKVLRNEDCVAAIPLLVMTDQHTAISKLRKVSKVV